MTLEPLPHGFPFRFAERTLVRVGPGEGRVRASVTAGSFGAGVFPGALLCELMAQAALLLTGGDAALGRSGFLAGFSDVTISRQPEPGDVLLVDVKPAGKLGPVVKFEASVEDQDGRPVARGALTVRGAS